MSRALDALGQLQRLLQSVHGVEAAQVRDFLIGPDLREHLAPRSSPSETLLVSEEGEELRIGLFLEASVLDQLDRPPGTPWTGERLNAFCAAAEGVSHFLYLSHRASSGGQVSQLELETQGEVDKYLAVLLQLWATGRRSASPALRRQLFENVSFRSALSGPERDRYKLASALAAACAKALEAKYVVQGRLEALLREARRLYRLSGGEKFSALANGCAI